MVLIEGESGSSVGGTSTVYQQPTTEHTGKKVTHATWLSAFHFLVLGGCKGCLTRAGMR